MLRVPRGKGSIARGCAAPRRCAGDSARVLHSLGIDFGTSSTLAAIATPSNLDARVAHWADGTRSQASVVHYPPSGSPIIGNAAAAMRTLHPTRTVLGVKRLLGRSVTDVPRGLLTSLPYAVRDGPNRTAVIDLGDVKVQPHETAALLLRGAKEAAETEVRRSDTDVVAFSSIVLTVPAQWGDAQRKATLEAANAAGMGANVSLISEPLAAALSMGLASADAAPMVIVDVGGGTMDVSVLKATKAASSTSHPDASVLTVAAHAGDALRGGLDFTQSVYTILETQWRSQGVPLEDVAVAAEAETEAEAVKVRLSTEGSTEGRVAGVCVPLTRADAEAAMWPHVERLLDLCREALQEARVRVKDVRTVLLVGGQSRAPLIRRSMHRMFARDATHPPAPEEAVACGAAIQAALRGRGAALVTRDATAFALGLEGIGGAFIPVLPRGSPLPCVADLQVTTAMDAQGFLRVRVLQGNSAKASDNKTLGTTTLYPLAPTRAGVPRVNVRFALDAQGFLQVLATDPASGASVNVAASAPPTLSEEDMLRLLREQQAAKRAEAEQEASTKVRAEAEAVVKYVEESLTNLSDRMPPDEAVELFSHVASTRRALEAGRSAAEVDSALNALRNQLRSALQRRRLDAAF